MRLNNYPALKFAVLFICGILFSSWLTKIISPGITAAVITSLILLLLAFIIFSNRKGNSENNSEAVIISLMIFMMIFSLGVLRSSFSSQSDSYLSHVPDMYPKRSINIVGIVNDIPQYDSNRVKFPLICEKVITENDTLSISGNILLTSYKPVLNNKEEQDKIKLPLLKAGDKISVPGYLHDGAVERNPGEFDYSKYLQLHNIDKLFTNNDCSEIKYISGNNLNFFYQKLIYPLKYYVFEQISRNIPGNEGAFLNGLITGIRSDLTEEVKQEFIDTGTAHIIAVSGLNVVYIILIITIVLSLLRIPLKPRISITIILLIYYCFFTGVSPSIVRATIMGSLILIAIILQRKPAFLNIIGVSAIVILLIDPKQLFDNGFLLSFASLTSIILVHNRLEILFISKLKDKAQNKFHDYTIRVIELVLVTFAAVAGTLPFALSMFGKISLVSFFTNIIAIPVSNFSLAIGIFQILISFVSSQLAGIIAAVNFYLLKSLLAFISYSSKFSFSSVKFSHIDIYSAIAYYVIFFSILFVTKKALKYFSPALIICVLFLFFHNLSDNDLKITFLDIGQGDCSIIKTSENKIILVDCGMNSMIVNSGERSILPYLERNGINKIDLLIISHLHMDHIGGLKYLLENMPVEKIYDSGQRSETDYMNSIDSLISVKNIRRETIRSGIIDNSFKDIRLYFMFPNSDFINSDGMTVGNNLNNGSLVFKLSYKNTSILFSGDVEKFAEENIASRYGEFLKCDILKSPHHGSFSSSTIPFIDKVHPDYAVISCGKFNRFNHPSDIILERYKLDNIKTIRTDKDNAAVFEYKDDGLKEVEWK